MKKSLTYVIVSLAVFYFINKTYGLLPAIGLLLAVVAFLLWDKRASVLTQMAIQAYFVNGDTEKGEQFYKMAYKTGLMNANCKISYSSFCLRENRFEKGRSLLEQVINSSFTSTADKINAKHNLAILTWKEGNLEEAIKILELVHKQMPATNTYGTLGVLYLERAKRDKNYADVLDFMLEAYDYNDSDKTIADNLGELYLYMAEYEKSRDVYTKLLAVEQITPMPYYNYGLVLKNMGDTEGARENFEKALNCRFTSVLTVTKEMVNDQLESLN